MKSSVHGALTAVDHSNVTAKCPTTMLPFLKNTKRTGPNCDGYPLQTQITSGQKYKDGHIPPYYRSGIKLVRGLNLVLCYLNLKVYFSGKLLLLY